MQNLVDSDGHLRMVVSSHAPARIAWAGNPSDLAESQGVGYVTASPCWMYQASVVLQPADDFRVYAPQAVYESLSEKINALRLQGIGGWENIVDAAILLVANKAREVGVEPINLKAGMHISSNIPRQRGMAGSSGGIVCIVRDLVIVHDLEDHPEFQDEKLAALVLDVEREMGLKGAGKQDRILQVYANREKEINAVAMDFASGTFEPIVIAESEFPRMALILARRPSHSGEAHNEMLERIHRGDRHVLKSMEEIADLGREAAKAIRERDWEELGPIMVANAQARVKLYGRGAMGKDNIEMVQACKEAECPANFTGSGGAMIAILRDGEESLEKLKGLLPECRIKVLN